MFMMPGRSHKGALPPLTACESELAGRLAEHVEMLAGTIGERNIMHHSALRKAAAYITGMFIEFGYAPREELYIAEGRQVENIEVQLKGASEPEEIVVIGAHYDSVSGSPGADDNASGVAAMLELARFFRDVEPPARTLRFVAFVNEEAPYFYWSKLMGSRVYAAGARKRGERIAAMISLETIGYYADTAGSQSYPPPVGLFYPHAGNFIAFVSNLGSRSLLHRCIGIFRKTTFFPSEGLAAPAIIPGVSWSDHWSFWREGYPAIMITDTAPYRYPHYHQPSDLPDRLDYNRMARVVAGIRQVVEGLVK
jgi:Zn-dependent M28 family amino/carboxypeptidase